MNGMEKEWKSLNLKKSEPKHIEDYNQTIETIMTQLKAEKKLKDLSPPPKPSSHRLEIGSMDKDIKILQEKNSLRRAKLIDKYENDSNRSKSVKLEIKSKFSDCEDYNDYKSKHRRSQNIYEEHKEVKKGAWRKDMARYEDDLELSKLRKETQKKINYLDDENMSYAEKQGINSSNCVNGTLRIEKTPNEKISNLASSGSSTITTCVTIKLKNNSEEKIDASLTIRPCMVKAELHLPEKSIDATGVKDVNNKSSISLKREKEMQTNQTPMIKNKEKSIDLSGEDKENIGVKTDPKHTYCDNHADIQQYTKSEVNEKSNPDSNVTMANPTDNKEIKNALNTENDDEDEDVSGMRAMRKETNNTLASMEAEFEEGRSKLAAVRARIKRAREMAKASMEE